jgi:hypothetical protein
MILEYEAPGILVSCVVLAKTKGEAVKKIKDAINSERLMRVAHD